MYKFDIVSSAAVYNPNKMGVGYISGLCMERITRRLTHKEQLAANLK